MRDAAALEGRIDAEIARMAIESGARPFAPPAVITRDLLERCAHFESFPGVAIAGEQEGTFLTPAACYHVYPELQGGRLEEPYVTTLVASCGRNEEAGEAPGRLRTFRMREIVFVGPSGWVSKTRDAWISRASELARGFGLDGSLAAATDTFFGDQDGLGSGTSLAPGRGRRLLQQLKRLKYELRMDAVGVVLAVSSFNLHESFFTSRFDIAMADGSPAASGCAAFGIERWALAYRSRHHACLR